MNQGLVATAIYRRALTGKLESLNSGKYLEIRLFTCMLSETDYRLSLIVVKRLLWKVADAQKYTLCYCKYIWDFNLFRL